MTLKVVLAIGGAVGAFASSLGLTFGTLAERFPDNPVWVIAGGVTIAVSSAAGALVATLKPSES